MWPNGCPGGTRSLAGPAELEMVRVQEGGLQGRWAGCGRATAEKEGLALQAPPWGHSTPALFFCPQVSPVNEQTGNK